MSDIICLIVGMSGSGKSTVVKRLCDKYKLKDVQSYTTRPKRYPKEQGHIFVTDEEFNTLENICAYTEIKGYKYGATTEQVDESDLYIIDEEGIEYFDKHYKGDKKIKIVRMYIDESTCILRMKKRGDSIEDIHFRMMFDRRRKSKFNNVISNAKNIKRDDVLYVDAGNLTPDKTADYIYYNVFKSGNTNYGD